MYSILVMFTADLFEHFSLHKHELRVLLGRRLRRPVRQKRRQGLRRHPQGRGYAGQAAGSDQGPGRRQLLARDQREEHHPHHQARARGRLLEGG